MRVGILGAGSIAGKMADTIAHIPDVENYAVASRDLKKAEEFAKTHGISKTYGSYEELLSDSSVDLIYNDGIWVTIQSLPLKDSLSLALTAIQFP